MNPRHTADLPPRAWLVKSEPDVYSIDQLMRDGRTLWTGVRNYEARNFMTRGMQVGDPVLVYHSNAKPPGIAGLARVSAAAIPDPTQLDPKSEYHDPRATADAPVWHGVELEFAKKAKRFLPLDLLRGERSLARMVLLQKGSRLSIQPVTPAAFARIVALAGLR